MIVVLIRSNWKIIVLLEKSRRNCLAGLVEKIPILKIGQEVCALCRIKIGKMTNKPELNSRDNNTESSCANVIFINIFY